MFIESLQEDPQWYLMVVATVVISIVLHELAHGWTAIWQGDRTPTNLGRMTGNPLIHMGAFALFALFLFGIAWGQMPIDSSRFRSRNGEAWVASAGPAMNLLLAFIALTGLGLWWRTGMVEDVTFQRNLTRLLFIFGSTNLLLCVFNLMPVPPLDGSHILANFHRGYAMFINDPSKQGMFILLFAGVFMFSGMLLVPLYGVAADYVNLLAGDTTFWDFVFAA